jgi:hypothetical protein
VASFPLAFTPTTSSSLICIIWKEYIITPIYKKVDKTDCNNYCATLLLSHVRWDPVICCIS